MKNSYQKSQSDEAAAKEETDETHAEVNSKATGSDDHGKEEGDGTEPAAPASTTVTLAKFLGLARPETPADDRFRSTGSVQSASHCRCLQ
jgi:hypothetical protein